MKIDILTIFPEMFEGVINNSMLKRAQEGEFVEIKIHNLRDWTSDKHNTVDDRPYGGGPGMIMKVDVIDKAVNELKSGKKNTNVILLDAGGNKYTQQTAKRLSKSKNLILIAGHYEGVDHRVHEHIADEVISIGDYVLTGGEIPAMVIVDSVVRLIPGVLGTEESLSEESHSEPGFLEYPQYTRPEVYKKWKVPKILLTGNHAEIAKWKKQKAKRSLKPNQNH
jgi:tRNA (guanine37-N1)-methyltransferase